jgi:hypothetical protein
MMSIPVENITNRSGDSGDSLEELARNKKKAETSIQSRINNYSSGASQGTVSVAGTRQEQESQLAGMENASTGYGQGLATTGQDIQRIKELQRGRTDQSGGDPVSAAIMGQRQGAMANAQRNLASSGVKGGIAANAVANVGLQQDQQIAASLYGQQRQSIADERSLASNTLAGTVAMMQGGKAEGTTASMPSAPSGGGMTVICTELYRQGIMPLDIYLKDGIYGASLHPETLIGYRFLANPVVGWMQKSKIVTKLVSIPAMAWANNMAGNGNVFGAIISLIGEPTCYVIGKIKLSILGAKYV